MEKSARPSDGSRLANAAERSEIAIVDRTEDLGVHAEHHEEERARRSQGGSLRRSRSHRQRAKTQISGERVTTSCGAVGDTGVFDGRSEEEEQGNDPNAER